MVKFLLHYAKHEVVLPKTTLIVEGKTCNRLFLLVNGVLQATHSKHVSKVRRSSDVDAVSPRPPSRFSLCTFSSLIAILDAILDATSMRSQVREMQAARNKSYANRRTTYSDRGTFVTDEVSEDESRITRASRMTMGGKRTAAARSLKHLQEESFNHGHHGGGEHAGKRVSIESSHGDVHERETQAQAFKRSMREAVVIERTGSMMGFPDPFVASVPAVYSLTCSGKVEVLVFDRHTLAPALCNCREEVTLQMCKSIEAEYNKLMKRLKAHEHSSSSVAERTESELKAEEFRRRVRECGMHMRMRSPRTRPLPHASYTRASQRGRIDCLTCTHSCLRVDHSTLRGWATSTHPTTSTTWTSVSRRWSPRWSSRARTRRSCVPPSRRSSRRLPR